MMNISPEAQVAHWSRGRVRLFVPSKKKDREYFAAAQTELQNIPTVKSVLTNPLTGTLLIHYQGKWKSFHESLDSSAWFKVSLKRRRKRRDSIPLAFGELRKIDKKLDRATDHELNLTTLLGLSMLGLSAVQLFRRQFLPPASTLISEGLWILSGGMKRKKKA